MRVFSCILYFCLFSQYGRVRTHLPCVLYRCVSPFDEISIFKFESNAKVHFIMTSSRWENEKTLSTASHFLSRSVRVRYATDGIFLNHPTSISFSLTVSPPCVYHDSTWYYRRQIITARPSPCSKEEDDLPYSSCRVRRKPENICFVQNLSKP